MKKVCKLLSLLAMTVTLAGCESEPVRVDNITDNLVVTNLEYREASRIVSYVPSGKAIVPVTRYIYEAYEVEFDYKGIKLKVDNKTIYNKVKDKKYQTVECLLNIEYYDNNEYEIKIIEVK